jgi:beta-lactamase class D
LTKAFFGWVLLNKNNFSFCRHIKDGHFASVETKEAARATFR